MSQEEAKSTATKGKVITVTSAKGGVGKTLMTVNLAVALNKKNVDVVVIDADFQFGDIGLALDLKSSLTIKELSEEVEQLDTYNVTNYLVKHSTGVDVLLAPERPEYSELITIDVMKKLIELLREHYDYIVIDAGRGMSDLMVDLFDLSEQVLAITTLEVASLKSTKQLIETVNQLGLGNKVQLIVNRHNMESLIKAEEVPAMLKVDSVYYTPNNFKVAAQSLNLGVPVAVSHAKSDLAKSIFKLAHQLTVNNLLPATTKKKGSLIGKVFSK
ncbi:AAA family ATPase [Alkalibacillus aidingensis]|uniref:AAA family ATPase n=1 Tax=Alkalibacillus aidingensis TaxID=2747607 RepID=UPI00166080AB|nr:AAA family ATPase [Alkalibacillus aidingensis]